MFLNVVSFVFVHLAVSNANRRQSSIAFIHGTGALDSSIKMTENIMHSPSKHHTHKHMLGQKHRRSIPHCHMVSFEPYVDVF